MNWKVIWKSLKNRDMQKKLLAVLAMVVVYRFLSHIPIPLAEADKLKQILDNLFNSSDNPQFLSFVNVLSGGALANFSIMLVGLGPYINASIIIQLLTKAFPKLEEMQKEGEYGRRKINQYTRILTFPLAIVQSIGAIYLVRQTANQFGGLGDVLAGVSISRWVIMVAALTGGAMILMWLGELITEQNVGNGISILITAGIVSGLPGIVADLVNSVVQQDAKWEIFNKTLPIDKDGLVVVSLILLAVLAMTIFVVYLNEAQRRLTVNYAKRIQGSRSYGGITSVLPIKLITAGVIPIIFAVAFLSIPQFAGQLMGGSAKYADLGANLTRIFNNPTSQYLSQVVVSRDINMPLSDGSTFTVPESTFSVADFVSNDRYYNLEPLIYPAAYVLLVIVFTYFYTSVMFNAKEISESLQKQGGFIDNVRPGLQTERYLSSVVTRLTLFGSIALGFLALTPILGQLWLNTDQIALGGTTVLILVSVALETLRQIESKAMMVTYDDYSEIGIVDAVPASGIEAATGARTFLRFRRK